MSPARAHVKRVKAKKAKLTKILAVRIFLVLLAAALCFFLGKAIYFSWKNRVWTLNSRVTVVVELADPKIYSYDPKDNKLISFNIPKDTQIETVSGYGSWKAGSIWELGLQEKKGGEFLRLSLQKGLGIPIDAWVQSSGDYLFNTGGFGWLIALKQFLVPDRFSTNLTAFDKARILLSVSSLGSRDRVTIDLEKQGIIVKSKLPDGEAGYLPVLERAKAYFEILRDNNVYQEAKKVVVINTTQKPGIATSVAQTTSVLGARVISVENESQEIENCTVSGQPSNLKSLTALRLEQLFGCGKVEQSISGASDLELYLGKKFAERY